jgi:hypothetical protein
MEKLTSAASINMPIKHYWLRLKYGCSTTMGRIRMICFVLLLCLVVLLCLIADEKRQLAFNSKPFMNKQGSLTHPVSPLSVEHKPSHRIYDQMPPDTQLNARIASILQLATQHGLVYNKASYSRSSVLGTRLQKCVINLPVLGTYPQLRLFIQQVMQENPSLALERWQVTREDVTSESVSATLLFNFYAQQTVMK